MPLVTHADRPHLTPGDMDFADVIRVQARVRAWPLWVGRLLFGGYFVANGLHHFLNLQSVAAYAATRNVPSPEVAVALTGLLLLVGGLSIMSGQWPKVGAMFLVLFLAVVTPTMHDFWRQPEPVRTVELVQFAKNVALFGAAFLAIAIPEPWNTRTEEPRAPGGQA
jgi:uncharacterized membrane protein YphA (DoxX/SURF4 family)